MVTPVRQALRVGYPIFMLVVLNGLGIWLVRNDYPSALLAPLLLVAIATSFVVERLIPYRADWNVPHDDEARDWAHFVVNEALNVASVSALPLVAALLPATSWWPGHWPLAAQLVVAVLVFDLGVTLTHWASHRVPILWRFHAVHHSVKRFYGFNGLMKHPVHQAVEMAVGVAPLVLLGIPLEVASLLAFATAIQLLLQHSNADYAIGPFRLVLALNAGHRFHHLKWAGVGDVNFGLFTNLWDHLMGTWTFDAERRFSSDDIGIGKQPDFPTRYGSQLAAPFREPPVGPSK